MIEQAPGYINKFSSVFEPALLEELETKSMLIRVNRGETI